MACNQILEIAADMSACKDCGLWQVARQPVPGEGPCPAKIMLLGQNPGATEDRTGRPFVGISGRYLDGVLTRNRLRREDLFITSVVKYKTPAKRHRIPAPKEIEACIKRHLLLQIKAVQPKIIVLMGKVAQQTPRFPGIEYVLTPHPAAALRFPAIRKRFEEAFAHLAQRIKAAE